jgi:hypothetical protein
MTPEQALAHEVVRVLDRRCKAGVTSPSWVGFENGNGIEVGREIERLIRRAKRILAKEAPATRPRVDSPGVGSPHRRKEPP